MTTHTLESLIELGKHVNGTARNRTIGQKEAAEMLKLLQESECDETVNTIRVYSQQGFVPNSYKYRCDIRYFEATRADGGFKVIASFTGAKRSYGNGALVTVNGRGLRK